MLKTSQVAKLFHKSPMTIGRWVDAFGVYLSHTAKITDGTERRFSTDDMRVLSLVWMMREQGNEFELITAALASGQRADVPTIDNKAVTVSTSDNRLALTERIHTLETEIERLRTFETKAQLLTEQNAALLAEIRKLEREIGGLLAKRD